MDHEILKIVSFNCKSINARLSEFKIFLYTERPRCVCLTETWLNEVAVQSAPQAYSP